MFMNRIHLNTKIYRIILIFTIITLSLSFLISLKPVFAQVLVAIDDEYTMLEDDVLSVVAPGVAANDSYTGSLTVFKDSDPATGSLTLDTTGAFTYTPPLDYNGFVTFTYHITDDFGSSSPAIVTITVTAINDPPVSYTHLTLPTKRIV